MREIMAKRIQSMPHPTHSQVTSLKDIGAWVRARRTEAQLRIDDAAALCGVSVQLLSDLENGSRSVGIDNVLAVMSKLGLTLHVWPRGEPFDHASEPGYKDASKT